VFGEEVLFDDELLFELLFELLLELLFELLLELLFDEELFDDELFDDELFELLFVVFVVFVVFVLYEYVKVAFDNCHSSSLNLTIHVTFQFPDDGAFIDNSLPFNIHSHALQETE
jgi:hypothetical protein